MTNYAVGSEGSLADIAELAGALGVPINNDLLGLSLIHRSFAYENGGIAHNERLEFLGDAILGQAVTVMLYNENPDLDEGDLAKRRASLVSSVALAEVARAIGLGRFVRLGKGEEQTGGRNKSSILADTVEAVIGAVYLSSGGEVATSLVLRLIRPLMDDPARFGAAMDPKTSLQELTTALGLGMPRYEVIDSGPDHAKRFRAGVVVGDEEIASGEGTSKKHAEMSAALGAWTQLQASSGSVAAESSQSAATGADAAGSAGTGSNAAGSDVAGSDATGVDAAGSTGTGSAAAGSARSGSAPSSSAPSGD